MENSKRVKGIIITNYGLNSAGGGVKVHTQNLLKALRSKTNVTLLIREGTPTEVKQKLPHNKFFTLQLQSKN